MLRGRKDVRRFFKEELRTSLQKQQVWANAQAAEYLTDLLMGYMESDKFFARGNDGKLSENVLVDLYAQYVEGSTETQKWVLKRLGDICLLITGFFADSLKRKLVDVDYYLGMGGTAYWQLSNSSSDAFQKQTYRELSVKFKPFSGVLGEISERIGITTNSDILRVYEKWLLTGSKHLKDVLNEHGVHPLTTDTKVPH